MTRTLRQFNKLMGRYIPKGYAKVTPKDAPSLVFYIGETNGRFYGLAYWGKANKPLWHHRFISVSSRAQQMAETVANYKSHQERTATRREARKAFVHTVQVGDIYRTSWGYDQTNVEFFEVVEVRGKHAVLREIASASEDDGHGSERCVPQSGAYLQPRYAGDDQGKPIRRLIQDGRIKICDTRDAWPWGKRTIAGVVIGKPAHRTAAGWGH